MFIAGLMSRLSDEARVLSLKKKRGEILNSYEVRGSMMSSPGGILTEGEGCAWNMIKSQSWLPPDPSPTKGQCAGADILQSGLSRMCALGRRYF